MRVGIACLQQLQTLDLNGCDKITDAGLQHISALQQLQTLSLERCVKIFDAGLAHLSALKELRSLSIRYCGGNVTNAGILRHLVSLPQLEWLDSRDCPLVSSFGEEAFRSPDPVLVGRLHLAALKASVRARAQ